MVDPRLQLLHFLRRVEGGEDELLLSNLLVLDVEPFLAPILDGFGHLEVKILSLWPNRDDGAVNVVDSGLRCISLDKKQAPP
jgi:hypothetical protein